VCKIRAGERAKKWACKSKCSAHPSFVARERSKGGCDDSACKGHGLLQGEELQCCPDGADS
jgi:hypothetical protein